MNKNVISLSNVRGPQGRGFCATPTAQQILSALNVCQRKGWMGAIVGAPGIGKTTTFMHYASTQPIDWRERRRTDVPRLPNVPEALRAEQIESAPLLPSRPGVLLATMTTAHKSPLKFIMALTRHITSIDGGASYAYEALRRKLRQGDLVIIDEAQHLQDDALDMVRSLHDETGVGIIIGGNPLVITRGGRARQASFAQFLSRIAIRLQFDGTVDEDLEALFDHHKVVGARPRAMLRQLGGPIGALRRISHALDLCHELAADGKAIELKHVEEAISVLDDR